MGSDAGISKEKRASRACLACRIRKTRCDLWVNIICLYHQSPANLSQETPMALPLAGDVHKTSKNVSW